MQRPSWVDEKLVPVYTASSNAFNLCGADECKRATKNVFCPDCYPILKNYQHQAGGERQVDITLRKFIMMYIACDGNDNHYSIVADISDLFRLNEWFIERNPGIYDATVAFMRHISPNAPRLRWRPILYSRQFTG